MSPTAWTSARSSSLPLGGPPGSSALERYADELAAIEALYSQAARKSAGYAALRPGESAAAEAGK
jgi:hypothetical protein